MYDVCKGSNNQNKCCKKLNKTTIIKIQNLVRRCYCNVQKILRNNLFCAICKKTCTGLLNVNLYFISSNKIHITKQIIIMLENNIKKLLNDVEHFKKLAFFGISVCTIATLTGFHIFVWDASTFTFNNYSNCFCPNAV